MSWNDDLKSPHLDIAGSTAPLIGVLAGPGTGKTTYGLLRRVTRLLEEGVPGQSILLISFTRTAANDLKEKVAALGAPGAADVRAGTLHAYCFQLLQRRAALAITHRTPRPLLAHERDMMLRDLQGEFGDIRERRKRLQAYEAGWARLTTDHPGAADDPQDGSFEAQVLRWLRHHRAMLIGEVVPLAYNLLVNNPALDELQEFKHILVDEYQDLNTVEQRLIDKLAEHDQANLFVVGDDDQSIYGFRYANPAGIRAFMERPDVETHQINVCGRCPEPVLNMANALISHEPDRSKPALGCSNTTPGEVVFIQWPDLESEIEGVVAAVVADVQRERRQPGDILILATREKIGTAIRAGLNDQNVEAHSYFNAESIKTNEAQEGMALLGLMVDSGDAVSWRVILGSGEANARAAAYSTLSAYALSSRLEEHEVLAKMAAGERLGLSVPALLRRYRDAIARLVVLEPLELSELVDQLFPDGAEATDTARTIALSALETATTVAELREKMITEITQPEVPQNPNFVRVMSLHKSKGLTSKVVYLVGAVDGLIPNYDEKHTEDEAEAAYSENRRLLYVALTRASEQLVISSSLQIRSAVAMGMGVKPGRTRSQRGVGLVVDTLAMPYQAELGRIPTPQRGVTWLAMYTA